MCINILSLQFCISPGKEGTIVFDTGPEEQIYKDKNGRLTVVSGWVWGREALQGGEMTVKNPPTMQETWVQSLGREDPLEEDIATHSSILAWRIPMDRGAWRATLHGIAKSRT